jgi:hypothetical protein
MAEDHRHRSISWHDVVTGRTAAGLGPDTIKDSAIENHVKQFVCAEGQGTLLRTQNPDLISVLIGASPRCSKKSRFCRCVKLKERHILQIDAAPQFTSGMWWQFKHVPRVAHTLPETQKATWVEKRKEFLILLHHIGQGVGSSL